MAMKLKNKSVIRWFKLRKKVNLSDVLVISRFEKMQKLLIENQKDTISIIKVLSNILFLLNGGAITVCISQSIVIFLPAIRYFVSGLLLSILLFIVGYISHAGIIFRIYYYVQHKKYNITNTVDNIRFDIAVFMCAMFFSMLCSFIFFLWGAEAVLDIVTHTKF